MLTDLHGHVLDYPDDPSTSNARAKLLDLLFEATLVAQLLVP